MMGIVESRSPLVLYIVLHRNTFTIGLVARHLNGCNAVPVLALGYDATYDVLEMCSLF